MAVGSEEITAHTLSADGNTGPIVAAGGEYIFSHQGGGGNDYGGGTIKLQYSEDGTNWDDVPVSSATAADQIRVATGRGTQYRINLASSTSPTIVASFVRGESRNREPGSRFT